MHWIYCYPAPYGDEILYSRNARYGDIMRYPGDNDLSIELFGKRTTAVVDLPTRLGHLAAALTCGRDPASLPDEANLTVDRLIDKHTLLPYYGLTLPADRLARIRQEMVGDTASVRMLAAVVAPGTPIVRRLRYCVRCVADQRKEHGECYWRRVHQTPGVIICPDHAEWLKESDVVVHRGAVNLVAFVPAERVINDASPIDAEHLRPFRDRCLTIARSIAWLLDHPVEGQLVNLQARYRNLLYDCGLMTLTGQRLKREKLIQAFIAHYPPSLLNALGCPLSIGSKADSRVPRIVLDASCAQPPLFHLMLIGFLGHTIDTFLNLPVASHLFGDSPWPCLNKIGDHYGTLRVRECVVYEGYYSRPTGIFCCEDCGFTYGRRGPDRLPGDRDRYTFVEKYGSVWENAFAEVWRDPKCTRARSKARRLHISVRKLLSQARSLGLLHANPEMLQQAKRLGLISSESAPSPIHDDPTFVPSNLATQDRAPQTLSKEEYRAAWLDFLATADQPGYITVREKVPRVYAWLWKHDRPYLKEHPYRHKTQLTWKPRRDWTTFDNEWAIQILETGRRLRLAPGFPRWVNRAALRSAHPEFHFSRRRRLKMPLTVWACEVGTETLDAYAVRCLWWAAHTYLDEGIYPTHGQLLTRARKNHTNARQRPIVRQTGDAIVAMIEATGGRHLGPYPGSFTEPLITAANSE